MSIENPFHEGELLIQQRVGEVEQARQNGRIISNTILEKAHNFIEQQPMVVLGSVDGRENVWASVLIGQPRFVKAINQQTVEIDLTQAACNWQDPFWTNIKHHPQIGMLIIELATRRRLRINGRITRTAERLYLAVDESYPNCPKYIQRRHITNISSRLKPPSGLQKGELLKPVQQAFIAAADTFFVASRHPIRGVDISHRGGNPGFIKVLDAKTLQIPDYTGNSMFNTLGNFVVNPRAGLVFLDFEQNRTLQSIGKAEIVWDGSDRRWNFEIDRWLEMDLLKPLQWEFLDYSPYNP